MNFLESFISLSKGTEVPGMFSLWCGISTLSAALARRVWLDMGEYVIYPNLYVVLVAMSGRCRKSTAVGIADKLLRQVHPQVNLIAQKLTPEALIDALKISEIRVLNGKSKPGLVPRKTSEGFVVAKELSTFLNRKAYESGLGSLLCELWDCSDEFSYRTKSRGLETLQNVCLGVLGASVIDSVRSAIPREAVGGGLVSRIIFVYEEEFPPPIAITRPDPAKKATRSKLVEMLDGVQVLNGEMDLTPQAWKYYETKYNEYYRHSTFHDDVNLSGYASRRNVQWLKLGMILALAEGKGELVVHQNHIQGGLEILEQSEQNRRKVIRLITMSDKGAATHAVLTHLRRHGKVFWRDLVENFSYTMDVGELHSVMNVLVQGGLADLRTNNEGAFYVARK